MKQTERNLPLSTVTLIFGSLSIPLAFARHLVSLALVLAVLALVFGYWGIKKNERYLLRYATISVERAKWGFRLGGIGALCSVVMWVLWATNSLF